MRESRGRGIPPRSASGATTARFTARLTARLTGGLTSGLLVVGLLAAGLVALSAPAAQAATVTTVVGGMTFAADAGNPSGGAMVTGYDPAAGTAVTIPGTVTINAVAYPVTAIASGAFMSKGLTSVTIPDSVIFVGDQAFRDNSLASVAIPDSVTTIGDYAFDSNQLTSVTIPNSVTILAAYVFGRNSTLASVTIPSSVTTIGIGAFAAGRLTSVTIPSSVTSIAAHAFRENALTSVTIPGSVTTLGAYAFYGNALTSVTIPSSITAIGMFAFSTNKLTSVTIPSSITSIGDSAFSHNSLTTVAIPNSVTTIGTYAFYFNKLVGATIPNSVTAIGDYAFYYNTLTSVTIPASVSSIGAGAFAGNDATLPSVRFDGNAPTITAAGSTGSFGTAAGKTLYFYAGATGFSNPWQGYATVALPPPSHTVSFHANGGTGTMAAQTTNVETTLTANAFTWAGHTFTGWNTSSTGTGTAYADGASYGFGADLALYAQWSTNSYTVTFDSLDGSAVDPASAQYGTTVAAPAAPTRLGYTFTGWFTDAGATSAFDFGTPITGALTLYAGWEAVEYSIAYDLAGGVAGEPANPVSYTIESGAIALSAPSRAGHTFAGWTGTGLTEPTASVTIPTGSTGARAYTATWTTDSYTVSFESNGGGAVDPVTVRYGDAVPAPAAPTCTGYAFAGWFTDADATEPYDSAALVTGPLTLYAGWEAVEYSIAYDLAGGVAGEPANPVSYTIESGAIALSAPSRAGYTFAGWTGTGLSEPAMAVTIAAASIGDRVYAATWEVVPATSPTQPADESPEHATGHKSPGALPATGSDIGPGTLIAAGLLLTLGTALTLFGIRRRRGATERS